MTKAYYNEFDPKAAAWLRNLIEAGLIAPGDVDERSIADVRPEDLAGYTQCHFFAGIGVWSYALRNSGWRDDQPVWTGSCPCQPFSSAGKRGGFDDERHLWPHFHWLIQQCRPAVVFGEQVASKAVEPWIDLVQADVEGLGYAFGCIPFPSAGVGAPHLRDRAFWVADASNYESQRQSRDRAWAGAARRESTTGGLAHSAHDSLYGCGSAGAGWRAKHSVGGSVERMGYAAHEPCERDTRSLSGAQEAFNGARVSGDGLVTKRPEHAGSGLGGLADTEHNGHGRPTADTPEQGGNGSNIGVSDGGHFIPQGQPAAGPANGFWRDADWLFCRDGKWRPVESGTQPLAHGAPARVVRLRAYGNAINAEAAQAFIESWLEVKAEEAVASGDELGRSDLDDLI